MRGISRKRANKIAKAENVQIRAVAFFVSDLFTHSVDRSHTSTFLSGSTNRNDGAPLHKALHNKRRSP